MQFIDGSFMKYRVLWLIFVLVVSYRFAAAQSAYVTKQGNSVYWAVTPSMDSISLLKLTQALRNHGIGFKPKLERNQDGLITQLSGNIIPITQNHVPPDTLLVAKFIRPDEQSLWPGSANLDVGNTPLPVSPVILPLAFSYNAQAGIRTDIAIEQLPASVRAQVEKEFSAPIVKRMLQENRQKLRQFRESLVPGKPAFDFKLIDTNGQIIRLSDSKGKVVYLDFWAHWCQPCMADMELLKKNYQRFNRTDLVFLSVSVDQPTDRDKWLNTLRKRQFIGQHVLAEGGWKGQTARLYGIHEVPTSFVIGRDGNFFATKLTSLSFGGLEFFANLLDEALVRQP